MRRHHCLCPPNLSPDYMQPEAPPNRSLLRRSTIVGFSIFAAAVAAAVFYDSSPPDGSDFLPQNPPVADSENGFLMFGNLATEIDDQLDKDRPKILELAGFGSTEWDAHLAKKILADNEAALETLSRALGKPSWYQNNTGTEHHSKVSTILDLARIKKIAAIHAFGLEDPGQGIQHLRDLYATAGSTSGANIGVIGELLHIIIEEHISAAIARIAPTVESQTTLLSLHELITANPPDRTSWQRALHSEYRFFKTHLAEQGRRGTGLSLDDSFTILDSIAYKPNITLHKILAIYRESASNTQAPNFAARTTTLFDQVSDPPNGWRKYINLNSKGDELAREASGSVATVELKTWLTEIYHIQALLLVALQRYQLDHQNQLPASLSELAPSYLPDLPTDPYNNSALLYDPGRRLIWSVGQNLTDEGGHHDPKASRLDAENPTIYIPLPAVQ